MTTAKKPAPAAKTPRRLLPDPRGSAPPVTTHSQAAALIASGVGQDGTINRRPTSADKRKAAGEELVRVTVARPFKFTRDDHSMVDYPAGTYDMPRAAAEDSFAQAHGGVTISK